MIYPLLLVGGLAGLIVMAFAGFLHAGHHGGHGHGNGHAHGNGHGHGIDVQLPGAHVPGAHGHGHVATPSVGHGHAPAAHGHHAHHGHGQLIGRGAHGENPAADGDADASVGGGSGLAFLMWLMPLTSPLNWCAWMVGAGAAGTVASQAGVHAVPTGLIALLGAAGFQYGIVKPIWNTIFRFASRPAGNLEACLLQEVEAATAFNERGEGLVRVVIDGREEDILARLVPEERMSGVRVRRGEKLLIEVVDPHTNSCQVSRS